MKALIRLRQAGESPRYECSNCRKEVVPNLRCPHCGMRFANADQFK